MHLVLYSTITRLAYLIGRRYYKDVHYVWCAPADSADRYEPRNPMSSHPVQLYARFLRDIETEDGHSGAIGQNRIGIVRGAESRFSQGVIDARQRDHISQMVAAASFQEFDPLLVVMPYQKVKRFVKSAPVAQAARATSEEFIISDLARSDFDVLYLKDIR